MTDVELDRLAFKEHFASLHSEICKAFIGQPEIVEQLLICFYCGGHLLLEGMPGLGKTLLVRTLGEVLDLGVSRVQCTPDLMPSDIIGTNVLLEDTHGAQKIDFRKGPIFSNIVLIDEINRATPKTQSAFLEAMQEGRVTALGAAYELDRPFFVLATQNPIEIEGTFPLPEAQLDRFFFKLRVGFPALSQLSEIIDLTTGTDSQGLAPRPSLGRFDGMAALVRKVKVADGVKQYALRLVLATHPDGDEAPEMVRRFVKYGASPRAAQSIVLGSKARALARGRLNVSLEDVEALAYPSLNHRMILNFEAEVQGVDTALLVRQLCEELPA